MKGVAAKFDNPLLSILMMIMHRMVTDGKPVKLHLDMRDDATSVVDNPDDLSAQVKALDIDPNEMVGGIGMECSLPPNPLLSATMLHILMKQEPQLWRLLQGFMSDDFNRMSEKLIKTPNMMEQLSDLAARFGISLTDSDGCVTISSVDDDGDNDSITDFLNK